jgi:hypothetical protein
LPFHGLSLFVASGHTFTYCKDDGLVAKVCSTSLSLLQAVPAKLILLPYEDWRLARHSRLPANGNLITIGKHPLLGNNLGNGNKINILNVQHYRQVGNKW